MRPIGALFFTCGVSARGAAAADEAADIHHAGFRKFDITLKNETRFGWTNLISLGKSTVDCVKEGNAQLMTDYSIAFFDVHLRGKKNKGVLEQKDARLESYQFRMK
jgi:hypothetical protein